MSRTTEAEDRISEIEDRMLEINETGKKKNKLKEMRTISETSGTMKCPNIWIIGVLEEEDKKKTMRKYLRR